MLGRDKVVILGVVEKVPELSKLAEVAGGVVEKVRRGYRGLEERLNALSRRQLILLAVVVGLLFLALGTTLGVFMAPFRSASSSPNEGSNGSSNTPSQETVSQTGVLRRFRTPEDEIEFYLEKADDTRVFLAATDKIDSSALLYFEGSVVTIEGTMAKSADGSKDVLRVEKIVLKR